MSERRDGPIAAPVVDAVYLCAGDRTLRLYPPIDQTRAARTFHDERAHMTLQQAIAVASILVTLIGGFAAVFMKLGRVELKIELLWNWFMEQVADSRPGGRRRTDPIAPEDRG